MDRLDTVWRLALLVAGIAVLAICAVVALLTGDGEGFSAIVKGAAEAIKR